VAVNEDVAVLVRTREQPTPRRMHFVHDDRWTVPGIAQEQAGGGLGSGTPPPSAVPDRPARQGQRIDLDRRYGRAAAAIRLTASGSSCSFSQAKLNRANGLGWPSKAYRRPVYQETPCWRLRRAQTSTSTGMRRRTQRAMPPGATVNSTPSPNTC